MSDTKQAIPRGGSQLCEFCGNTGNGFQLYESGPGGDLYICPECDEAQEEDDTE